MQVDLKSPLTRRMLMLAEVAVFLAAVGWIAKAYVANVVTLTPTAKNLELAVRLDPRNANYHLMLGRLYEYSVADIQPEKALEHFRRAVQLNPNDPQAWLDLGTAIQFQGNTSEAERCLRSADLLAPNMPAFQWPIGNFYLLQGNVKEAFRHLKVVLAGTSQYDQIVFTTAWKASEDPNEILEQLIPQHPPTEFSYLYFLLSQQRFEEAQAVWKRIMSGSESFGPQAARGYMDTLINARRPGEAYEIWTEMQNKGLIPSRPSGAPENLISNSDFEGELLNLGFNWRIGPVEGVYVGLDQTTFHSPSHALLVQFSGNQNVDYHHVFQYVKVSPGRPYRLQAFMKTEGITTDSGPRLLVYDAYEPAVLARLSENLTESTNGWTPVSVEFTTGPKTELIIVVLVRGPSRKLDNLIAGKVWLDDVRLTPQRK